MTNVRILVCDPIPVVRDGVCAALESEPEFLVVGSTGNGDEALAMVRRLQPQVVITDVDLAGASGVDLIRRLRHDGAQPRPQAVVFTHHDDEASIVNILEAGACGLLVKGVSRGELVAATWAAAGGQVMLCPQVARRLLDWVFRGGGRPRTPTAQALSVLTSRERDVLRLIAQGLSSEEIAEELSLGVATVRTHTYRLRRKLDLRDRVQLVSFAYRSGFSPSMS